MKAMKSFLTTAITALALVGCSHNVYVPVETVSTDTLRIVSHDTVKVTERLAPVSISLPHYHKERTTQDSVSILENGLYRSTASLHDGTLTHTMESLPGAKVEGHVAVHDTVRVLVKGKDHKRYNEKPKVICKTKELGWLEKKAMQTGYVAWGAIVVALCWLVIRWRLK